MVFEAGSDLAISVYNTLTRRKEPFVPVHPGRVGMYVCGPTVYKPSHVGHMVGPVIFDTVKRFLSWVGYQVKFVVNITDIDDKLIVEAAKQNSTVPIIAERVTADYMGCLKALGVRGIDLFPKATDHIPEILSMIESLIAKGHAYPSAGDVYFDVASDGDYGKLCNRDPEQMEAGARIEISDRKKNPGDFALWKGAKPGEPSWPSPWGPGRPGWHIECSAMSLKWLGAPIDIHGGGLDLQFPHHENELAQSESHLGHSFTKYWMHNGLMKTGDKKMSKSEGNEVVVSLLLKRHKSEAIRYLLLSSHYRSPIEFSEARLEEVGRTLEGFHRFFELFARVSGKTFFSLETPKHREAGRLDPVAAPEGLSRDLVSLAARLVESLADDFNTGGAIGALHEMLTRLNRFVAETRLEENRDPASLEKLIAGATLLRECGLLLGLFEEEPVKESGTGLADGLMKLLIELRAESRKTKNFAMADQIRKGLTELNITLEDRPGGTIWRQS